MRKMIIVALVLVVIGVAVSLLFIPDENDIVAVQSRDVENIIAGNVDVEAEYNQGRRSYPIVAAYADKKVNAADRPGAIALLEEYVKVNPNDVKGRKKLAEQYQLAGRQQDFNIQLEQIAALAPTEQNLRVLSDIYNADKNYPKQVEVLKKILEVTKGEKPQVFVDLATIQVVIGDKDGALATVQQLKTNHPKFESYAVVRIQTSILAEKGQSDDAFAIAKQWVDRPIPPPNAAAVNVPPSATPKAVVTAPVITPASQRAMELADLCNILHYSGHADKGVALVEPHLELLEQSTELVVAYVNANITIGRDEHAYQILTKIDEAGKMTPELYLPYLQLAIKREDVPAAEGIATRLDVTKFNEEQALNIIEVARANNAASVTTILLDRFNEPTLLADKPVLTAVIAIMKKEKDQDKKIEIALNQELTSVQRVRLAESCARAGKTECFDTIVKQYPPIDQQTTQQISEYAQLFIIAKRPSDVIDGVGTQAALPNAHPDVQDAHRKLACAAGREDIMKPWLEANANSAPVMKLQQYFYLANDHGHHTLSTDIAERMYARDPSPMSRDLMIAAYIGGGDYAKALPYLREQIKQDGVDDGLYLTALSKLAHKDKEARKELTDYALAALQSSKGDSKAQINYAYVLLNNGRRDEAMPFIKQYAAERGGEWKKMYAQLTTKTGKGVAAKKLTREERVTMAANPKISDANKRQIAFSLLNDGYKDDATKIFAELAQNKGPDSQEVKDLLYMWGGKLNPEQIAWLQLRAAAANGYDKDRWAEMIAIHGDDYAIMQYVSATPDALYNKSLRQKYFHALATNGGKQNFDSNMRGWVAQTSDVPALVDYAQVAQAYNYRDASAATYKRILELDPNNERALNQMSAEAFSKGSYSQASQYVERTIQSQALKGQAETSASQAHFYKAELLRRQGDKAMAQREYTEVVRLTQAAGETAPDALSRLYTAEFRIGQHAQAKSGFEQLLAQYPDDKNILADYMSVLIEFKYFEDATRIANQYDKASPYYGRGAALLGTSAHVASIQRLSGGREIQITFDTPIEGKSPINAKKAEQLAWVEGTAAGYDSITISAKPGYVIRYTPTANEQFAVVAAPVEESAPQQSADRLQDLRLQLLYAQIEEQTGQKARAKQRVAVLRKYYPNDPQLIAFEASLESSAGNSYQAIELLRRAQALQPTNEDIPLQMQALRRTQTVNYAKVDHEWRAIGDNNEQITTLSGAVTMGERGEFGMNLQNNFMDTHLIRNPENGVIDNYETTRQNAEIYVAQHFDGGDRGQFSLFANNDTPGAGIYYAFNNPLGRTQLQGEYHRPYWDFVEAVFSHANRDLIGFTHDTNLTDTLSMGIETSLNNYNIKFEDDVMQSYLLRASFVQEINAAAPYFGIGYGFDGEYITGGPERDAGNTYDLLPFRKREVHFFSGILADDLTPSTHVLLIGGWAFDRFNEDGPVVEGRLTQDLSDELEAGLRARYGFETSDTDNSMTNVGGYLMMRF